MSAARILVIDDNAQNLLLLVRFLQARGFAVDSASCTRDADEALARAEPRLALVDVSMPDEDGLSWVRRTRPRAPNVRYVALTAHSSADVRAEAFAAGCDGFMTKPIGLKNLLAAVESHLAAAESNTVH